MSSASLLKRLQDKRLALQERLTKRIKTDNSSSPTTAIETATAAPVSDEKVIIIEDAAPTVPTASPPTASIETERKKKDSKEPERFLRRVGSFSHYNVSPEKMATVTTNRPKRTIELANDYSQHFVDSGERPQNFVQGADPSEHYEEHPIPRRLRELKNHLILHRATPPMSLHVDLKSYDLARILQFKFDVILIDPPMEEYARRSPLIRAPLGGQVSWSWSEIIKLRLEDVSAAQSFVFLWVGCEEGLEEGRRCLNKWGFRRVEDIVWLKTNKRKQPSPALGPRAALQHTKEHCLVGIHGTVRRSEDGHFIHANCDTDVIISEDLGLDNLRKPDEQYSIIEHFCMGRRRLELFGEDHNIRPGWVTAGLGITSSNYNPAVYDSFFDRSNPADLFVGATREIEEMRPKSPPPEGISRNVIPNSAIINSLNHRYHN